MASTLSELLVEVQELAAKLESLGFGGESESVTHNGVTRSSLQKSIADKFVALQAMANGLPAFETKTILVASGAPTADANGNFPAAYVWGDSTVNNNGLWGWDGSSWAKSPYDAINAADGFNLFFDPLNQMVTDVPDLNGFSHFSSYTYAVAANAFSVNGNAIESLTDGDKVQRDFHIPAEYIGKSMTVRVFADFDVGGNYSLVYRRADKSLISSNSDYPAPSAGSGFYSIKRDVPAEAAILSVVLDPSSGKVRASFFGASFQGVPQPSELVDTFSLLNLATKTNNILFDSFNEYASIKSEIAGFKSVNSGEIKTSNNGVTLNPVLTNSASSPTKFERLYNLSRARINEGDSFNLIVSVWAAAGCTCKIHFRNSNGSVNKYVTAKYPVTGFNELSFNEIVVPVGAYSLSVIIENPSASAELISSLAAKIGVPNDNEVPPTPVELAEIASIADGDGVVGGQLIVNGETLSPADLYVDSAHLVSAGLWEFYVNGKAYRVLESNPAVVVFVPKSGLVTMLLVSGQSLGMGDSSGSTIDPAASLSGFTGQMLMPAGYHSQGPGDSALSVGDITQLEYLENDSGNSHSPATSAVYQALNLGLDASFIVLSHGIGGQQIEYLRDGNSFANGVVQIQDSKALVESYGLTVNSQVLVVWNQGEADGTDTNYYDDLNGLVDLYKGEIETHLGTAYSMTFLLDQVSRHYSTTPALAQYQVGQDRDDAIMVLTKAHMQVKYNMALETGGSDYTHMSKRGYFLMGAYWGKAIHGVLSTGDFRALDKRAVIVDGDKIHIDFYVGSGRLVSDLTVNVALLGFNYSDSLGASIISAEIVSGDRVTLTMSADIEAATNRKLELGRNVEALGQYTGSPLRSVSRLFIPEMSEYLHDWALCWEVDI